MGVVCTALIVNLQYGWTLFVNPIHVARGWSQAEIQWAFSIFIATETWLTPPAGAIVDRLGPRLRPGLMIAAGGGLVGLGWTVNAFADFARASLCGGRRLGHWSRRGFDCRSDPPDHPLSRLPAGIPVVRHRSGFGPDPHLPRPARTGATERARPQPKHQPATK